MKKTLTRILCLCAVLVMGLLPLMAEAESNGNEGYYYVKTNDGGKLNVREAASVSSTSICKIPYRSLVLVYAFPYSGWAYIECDNPKGSGTVKGYVMTKFLVEKDPGPYKGGGSSEDEGPTYADLDKAVKALKVLDTPYTAYIKTKNPGAFVHLRWIPNTSARYIDKYLAGEEIEVLAESKAWAQVRIVDTGYVGFIVKSCVDPAAN